MTFWTIMVITYGAGMFENDQSFIPYPSVEACGAAIEQVWDTFDGAFPDMMIQCVPTGELSSVLRPKRNPRYE